MASQYRVLFAGGILEGHEKDTVKRTAAARLKLSSAQLETIFSGQKIILKKGLSAEEASRYGSQLEKIGMRIRVQKMATEAVVPTNPVAPTEPLLPALDNWPPADANLPSGGIGQRTSGQHASVQRLGVTPPSPPPEPEYDPEKTHIYSPGVHAQLFAEANQVPSPTISAPPPPPRPVTNTAENAAPRAQVVDSVAGSAAESLTQAAIENIAVQPQPEPEPTAMTNALLAGADELSQQLRDARSTQDTRTTGTLREQIDSAEISEDPPLLGTGFDGRLGRVGFLIGSLVVKSAVILLVLIASGLGKSSLIGALVIGGIPGLYFLLRLAVLRLHDLGTNGRLCLLMLIPGINLLAFLYWSLFPGNRNSNRYGAPGSTAGAVPVLITMAVFAAIVTIAILLFPRDLLGI